jgi:hypothetical protein
MVNGKNGNRVWLYAIVVAAGITIAGATLFQVFVKTPDAYATKLAVSELKCDLKEDLSEVKNSLRALHDKINTLHPQRVVD